MNEVTSSAKINKTVAQLVKNLSARNRDIVTRRFGLKTGRKETLESIGQSYSITRERVRQIEEFTLGQLIKAIPTQPEINGYVSEARGILSTFGGVMREGGLFKAYSGNEKDSVINSSLVFLLTLSKELIRVNENNNFYSFWALSEKHAQHFRQTAGAVIGLLEKSKSALPQTEFVAALKSNGITDSNGNFSDSLVATILSISKDLGKNIFNEIGLVIWPEIHPRGVRDKAYLVLKKESKPKHFSEIAKLINTVNFSNRKANIQTVHNELIKDHRFVLVGRGTYALSEWGYRPGTVKEVLVDILRSAGPLPKTVLIGKTMDARMVKENTILLNLQDSKVFHKREDGTYALRKA